MEYRSFVVGDLFTNCYVIWSDRSAGVVDPGGPVGEVISLLKTMGLQLEWILNTHGHVDHIAGNRELIEKFQAPLLIHQADRSKLTSPVENLATYIGMDITSPDADRTVQDGDILKLGKLQFKVIETPGHTQGGIAIYTEKFLFAGDTLFYESIGRTDLPDGDHEQLIKTIKERLLILPPETVVLPGHGEPTDIEHELDYNPYLNDTDAF